MEAKIAKLQAATDDAESKMNQAQEALQEATKRVAQVKDELRALAPETQATLQINDTELPEALEVHAKAESEYDTWKARYDTNKRYLEKMQGN
mmetsp:Transcript_30706/g.47114  ORF Transcript_30706/g.47114 Transcript_30706/m.47114 type:complete len:93 (-) Transcript_30706:173-451(-)